MVRAKFQVSAIERYLQPEGSGRVMMIPVYKSTPGVSGNACEENKIFGQYTPSASVSMTINNPEALKQFEIGKFYYVDFTEAPE